MNAIPVTGTHFSDSAFAFELVGEQEYPELKGHDSTIVDPEQPARVKDLAPTSHRLLRVHTKDDLKHTKGPAVAFDSLLVDLAYVWPVSEPAPEAKMS